MAAAKVYTFRASAQPVAGRFSKDPSDQYLVAIDLSPILPPTATITIATVSAIKLPEATPDPSVLATTTAKHEGQVIYWMVQSGSSEARYQLLANIRDNLNQRHRKALIMTVR